MLFFKRRKPVLPKPDPSKVRLYNGNPCVPDGGNTTAPYTYTLTEWFSDSDEIFPEFSMDCALSILDDYPVVVNCLRPLYLDDDSLRTDVAAYLKDISWMDFGWRSSVVTMTKGPDRDLISTQSITDESVLFTFYAYRQLPSEGTLPGTPFVPDVEICFAHLHTRLVIKTMNSIDIYAEKIRAVCEKYNKTLVVQELPSKPRQFDKKNPL